MQTVTDTNGRTWALRCDIGGLSRVRQFAGVDLLAADPRDVAELLADPVRLADVAYWLCHPQAMALAVTRDAFAAAQDGHTLIMVGEALLNAIGDGSPKPSNSPPSATPADQRDPWETIYSLAGTIGIDPAPLTVRELLLLAESRSTAEWDHAAAMMAAIWNANPYRGKSKPINPADLNPMRKGKPRPKQKPVARINVEQLWGIIKGAR